MLSRTNSLARWQLIVGTVAIVGICVGALSLSARVVIPLEPVPVSLQVMVSLLIGLTLGPRLGGFTVASYVALGLAGAPIFARPPYSGVSVLSGSSGGYLIGMIAAAFLVGLLSGKRPHRLRAFAACLAGLAVIYFVGASWLGIWLSAVKDMVPREAGLNAWTLGIKPFLLFDGLKIVVTAGLAPLFIKGAERLQERSLLP